ncbi:MAG TPA: choice-of-anchor tandem repeat GloVer-containing protein [Acetobacteraceae bacterium]|nr:choice-of-anchor tandem repeat GloVer-containing protein [Acetobacteraceae bacterium]
MIGVCGLGVPLPSLAAATETVIYSFSNASGFGPLAGLTKVGSVFYGTTAGGGQYGYGTVFSLTEGGTYKVLYSFSGYPDVIEPEGPLLYSNGKLYGTSLNGGSEYGGTVFEITRDGKYRILHSFGSTSGDGIGPAGPLIELNGTMYGTTSGGGSKSRGTVFSITPAGVETVIYSLGTGAGDGGSPRTALAAMNGVLYGTTLDGSGTAFSVTVDGSFKTLYDFPGPKGASFPWGTLLPVDGVLYGTTQEGGGAGHHEAGGKGVLYSLTTSGKIAAVGYFGNQGRDAIGNLISKGKFLYGTAQAGGSGGAGTIFKARLTGYNKIKSEFSFNDHTGGTYPSPGLIRVGGSFYGTTQYGGANNQGTIFKISP